MNITLATYIIHRCIGLDGRFSIKRTLAVLNELEADVIALQEVETIYDDGLEILNYFSAELGMTQIPGPTMFRQEGHYGNAMLTRLPVLDLQRVDLSFPHREPRGALDAALACHGGRLQVVPTIWA